MIIKPANNAAAYVVVSNGPGLVSILDGRSGALIGALPVGLTPGTIAIDRRTGRALVLDNGGAVAVSDPWPGYPAGCAAGSPSCQGPTRRLASCPPVSTSWTCPASPRHSRGEAIRAA